MGMINTPLLSSQHPHRHRPTCRQLELCLVTVTGFTEWTAKMPWGHWVSSPKRSKGGVEDPKNLGFSKFSADFLKKWENASFLGRKHPDIWRIYATFKDGIVLGIYLLYCVFLFWGKHLGSTCLAYYPWFNPSGIISPNNENKQYLKPPPSVAFTNHQKTARNHDSIVHRWCMLVAFLSCQHRIEKPSFLPIGWEKQCYAIYIYRNVNYKHIYIN